MPLRKTGWKNLVSVALIATSMAATSILVAGPAAAERPTIKECMRDGRPFSYAHSKSDHNIVAINHPYFISVESLLFRCGGYVAARHIVHFDSRWLDPGTKIHLRISTKRSDGRWVGADRTITAQKNFSDETYYQLRGIGSGLQITDVHVKHFPEPGQTGLPVIPRSTAKATYGSWNGPEASPR